MKYVQRGMELNREPVVLQLLAVFVLEELVQEVMPSQLMPKDVFCTLCTIPIIWFFVLHIIRYRS